MFVCKKDEFGWTAYIQVPEDYVLPASEAKNPLTWLVKSGSVAAAVIEAMEEIGLLTVEPEEAL